MLFPRSTEKYVFPKSVTSLNMTFVQITSEVDPGPSPFQRRSKACCCVSATRLCLHEDGETVVESSVFQSQKHESGYSLASFRFHDMELCQTNIFTLRYKNTLQLNTELCPFLLEKI